MAVFCITYDLRKQRNYDPLITELRRLKAIDPLESVWLLDTSSSADDVHDHIRKYLDADDGLLVFQATAPRKGTELKQGTGPATGNLLR